MQSCLASSLVVELDDYGNTCAAGNGFSNTAMEDSKGSGRNINNAAGKQLTRSGARILKIHS